MAKLFWLQPDNTIVEFPLKAEQSLIGQSSRCDVRIKHSGISAEHAIIRQVSGVMTVEDLASTNGTRVNGKQLAQIHTLRHGDQIGVGRERLIYFAELAFAANFMQPESMELFAILAPSYEHVDTDPDVPALHLPSIKAPLRDAAAPKLAAYSLALSPPPGTPLISVPSLENEPLLDITLLAALPKGATFAWDKPSTATAATIHAPAATSVATRAFNVVAGSLKPLQSPHVANTAQIAAFTPPLMGSVVVLSGPATGKRYMLTSPSVTLGKEGKQVVEFVHANPTCWQILQREGITPAYINGDALTGSHELVAGDVVELTGVRLRFEILLTEP